MAILSTNQRLINVGDSYSAGNGIDITNNIISVTGDNAPYSAGQNIYFDGDDNHVINGKDWSNDIEQASANAFNTASSWVAQNYANSADMTYISAMVDTKLDTSAWSSVSSDLATESYVIMANNMTYDRVTGYVESQGFATETFVNENTSGKLDSSAFNTWQQGQYTNDIAGLNNLIGTKLDSSSFSDVSGTFYTNDNPSGFITGVDLSNYYTKDETSGKEELASAFANIPVGDPEVNAYVTSHSAAIDESTNLVQSNSSTWNDVTAYQSNSANYITAHQSLEGLMSASLLESADGKWTAYNNIPFKAGDEFPVSADEAIQCVQTNSGNWNEISAYELVSANYLTAHQDISNLMPKSESANFYPMTGNPSGFINNVEFEEVNLSSLATTAQINGLSGSIYYVSGQVDNKLDTTSFSDVSGSFLTAHQDLSDYATTADLALKQDTLTFGYNEQNKISAINNSALAGGGEVPEGTMVESSLEYNSQGYINGYNGSAVATIDQERQWFTHDDTLTHLSNSSQYALGVNMSAISADLSRMMGVDETVLFSGDVTVSTAQNVINLNESLHNFEKIKIYDKSLNMSPLPCKITELEVNSGSKIFGTNDVWFDIGWNPTAVGSHYQGFNFYSGNSAGTQWVTLASYIGHMGASGVMLSRNDGRITKVVGVGRISGGN